MYTLGKCAVALICTNLFVFEPACSFRTDGRVTYTSSWTLDGRIHGVIRNARCTKHVSLGSILVAPENIACPADGDEPKNADDLVELQCDEVVGKPPDEVKEDLSLDELREAVTKEGLDQQLSDIILSEPDRPKDPKNSIPLWKCNWFNTDDPVDSDDELLIREYCSQRVPDIDTIYKKLDPHGLRRYVPTKMTTMERTLGRVYEVNQPLIDEEAISQNQNTHALPPDLQGSDESGNPVTIDKDETYVEDVIPYDETYRDKAGPLGDIETTSANQATEADQPTGCVTSESDEEDDCPENYIRCANMDPNDDSVIEDEAYRYFLTLPMLSWTTFEKEALGKARSKLISYHNHYKETDRQLGTSSPYTVFTADACSSVGVSDGSCDMSLAEEVSAMETLKVDAVELPIEQYKHSDLLNDIDAYEEAEYPTIVAKVCKSDADSPIFTMDEFVPTYSDVDVVNPRVYVSVPKSSVKEGEDGLTVLNEQFLVKRVRDKRMGGPVSEIPLNDQPQIGTILIPNEFGYQDQNIRYLADEVGVISRSLVFVPDISENDLMFSLTMNRLIKLIQMVFNVDRIALVALGSQGRRVIHYVYTAMRDTIDRTLHDFHPVDPKLDPDKYCRMSNISRLENILRRQSTVMLDDIIDGIQRIEHNLSIKAAEKSRDYMLVKPLSNILQGIVLWDSVNVNFKEVAEMGVPVLFNMSNRGNLFEGLLRLDDPKYLSRKEKCTMTSSPCYLEVFDFANGMIPKALSDTLGEHVHLRYRGRDVDSVDTPDMYHMTTNHTGIDVCMNVFPWASSHFYMKKPGASREELKAIGNSILSCADWINSWSY